MSRVFLVVAGVRSLMKPSFSWRNVRNNERSVKLLTHKAGYQLRSGKRVLRVSQIAVSKTPFGTSNTSM